ncbi:hypothetical protein EGM70_03795 [Enterobacteriaceae bacterium 89]|nr:hypothetical protein [Enterobacteriaceae bacterium 89]
MMKRYLINLIILTMPLGCVSKPPSQVIYRYDENRYLELTGYDCQGDLWYHDIKRNIHYDLSPNPVYRVFTGEYIHPSERYILVPSWEPTAYTISRDYGKTWSVANYMQNSLDIEIGKDGYPHDQPEGEYVKSITVANDQAFITTKQGHLYMSSYPVDDPRLMPGGAGIDYTIEFNGEIENNHLDPKSPGNAWGTLLFMKEALADYAYEDDIKYKNLPNKVPDVKVYKGWNHMRCDMNAGR